MSKTLTVQTFDAVVSHLNEIFELHREFVTPFYVHPDITEESIGSHLLKDFKKHAVYLVIYNEQAPFDTRATATFLRGNNHLQYSLEAGKHILVSAFEIDEKENGQVLVAGQKISDSEGKGLLNELQNLFD